MDVFCIKGEGSSAEIQQKCAQINTEHPETTQIQNISHFRFGSQTLNLIALLINMNTPEVS